MIQNHSSDILGNQRRTIYWLATFCCVIFGFIAIIFDRVGKFREVARKE